MSYEQFAVALDSHFGQLLWEDCPDVANQVFAELMGRILDLDVEFGGAAEADMVVTIFQYSAYFLGQGWWVGGKCVFHVVCTCTVSECHLHIYVHLAAQLSQAHKPALSGVVSYVI